MDWQDVIAFWFEEIEQHCWFKEDVSFDQMIQQRFTETYLAVSRMECWRWREQPLGALAEIIVLDQFTRNMFRGTPQAFSCDGMALLLAQEAILKGHDKLLPAAQRTFMYMPFMHSESKVIHQQAVVLFSQKGLEGNLDFELRHQAIIERFSRYPHRNEVLGRESSLEEIAFLQQPGSSF